MVDHILLKILLAPFALLFGSIVAIKEAMYRTGLIKGVKFDLPLISVGNLTVGGTGKTPHIELLIRLLEPYLEVATLSRGYKRKTSGFRLVKGSDSAMEAGDEPLQFKRKFPNVTVAVGENRVFAVPSMLGENPRIQTILLDDAFQHRAIIPGYNILLTEYERPFYTDQLLPVGKLREFPEGYKRADMIIVSKCPNTLERSDAEEMIKKLKPLAKQSVFFTKYNYGAPYFWLDPSYRFRLSSETQVILISGIANESYLLDYLRPLVGHIEMLSFPDHHLYTEEDLLAITNLASTISGNNKVILTTEKDAVRLATYLEYFKANKLDIYILPIEVGFHFDEKNKFESIIKEYLLNFKS